MTPAQATALRQLIEDAIKSSIATALGVQIPKPGSKGHARICLEQLDTMITDLTDKDPA